MDFKVDENLPRACVDLLRAAKHDALSVSDQGLTGAADTEVSACCLAERRILVTLDLDFADIRTYPPEGLAGIVVLRPDRQDAVSVARLLGRVLTLLAAESPVGKLWIVESDRVRVRE